MAIPKRTDAERLRCPSCDYPYDTLFSGRVDQNSMDVDKDGNIEIEIPCEGCYKTTLVTAKIIKKEIIV